MGCNMEQVVAKYGMIQARYLTNIDVAPAKCKQSVVICCNLFLNIFLSIFDHLFLHKIYDELNIRILYIYQTILISAAMYLHII